jgi:hypothetical protein
LLLLNHTLLAAAMPSWKITMQIPAKRQIYKGFLGVLIIWRRSKMPGIPVSF